jgi:hypothetical protein
MAYIVAAICVAVGIAAAFAILRPPTATVAETIAEEEQEVADSLGAPTRVAQPA